MTNTTPGYPTDAELAAMATDERNEVLDEYREEWLRETRARLALGYTD